MSVRVKICCISSVGEARMAVRWGAHALGLVSRMPSGPGVISDGLIGEIARALPPAVASVLLTCAQDTESIIAQQRAACVNTLQLCDRLTGGTHADLREALPGVAVIQVIHVRDESSVDEALEAAPHVQALLLDSGNPSLATKTLGGTGQRHDWSLSRKIRDAVHPTPLFLAGGLTPDNALEAIETVGPYGLDVCTGVRTDGHLDEMKLAAFMRAVQAATPH